MKKHFFNIFIMLLLSCFCSSCGDEGKDDNVPREPFEMFIRFQTPSGENIASSWEIFCDESNSTSGVEDGSDMNLEVISENDGRNLFTMYSNKGWFKWNSTNGKYANLGDESLNIIYAFTYFDARVWSYGIKNYNDVYRISFRNPYIFGDSETHVIRIFIYVEKAAVYRIYKCEYDGKDITSPEMYGIGDSDGSYAQRLALKVVVKR